VASMVCCSSSRRIVQPQPWKAKATEGFYTANLSLTAIPSNTFPCNICGRRCTARIGLTTHMRSHKNYSARPEFIRRSNGRLHQHHRHHHYLKLKKKRKKTIHTEHSINSLHVLNRFMSVRCSKRLNAAKLEKIIIRLSR